MQKYLRNRVGDQQRHWKKIWREVWSVQRRLTVDCRLLSRIPRTVRLARKGIYIIYGPWLCFRDLPCHFLRSPCGLLEHGDRGDGHSSRMFYIFLSRRRSGFSSGSKLRLLSLQWCNPSSNLDTFYGGKQWRPSYLSYCLCPSTQIQKSKIVWRHAAAGTWRQSEIPVVMYRMRTDRELGH